MSEFIELTEERFNVRVVVENPECVAILGPGSVSVIRSIINNRQGFGAATVNNMASAKVGCELGWGTKLA